MPSSSKLPHMKEVWDIPGKPRWSWEKSERIYVYGLLGINGKDIEIAIDLGKDQYNYYIPLLATPSEKI